MVQQFINEIKCIKKNGTNKIMIDMWSLSDTKAQSQSSSKTTVSVLQETLLSLVSFPNSCIWLVYTVTTLTHDERLIFKCTYLPNVLNISLFHVPQPCYNTLLYTDNLVAFFLQQDPNSSIHFSYFSKSAADTDLETFFSADSKSSMVVGMCISSREMLRISSGVRPSILRLIAIREASLQCHTTLSFKHWEQTFQGLLMTLITLVIIALFYCQWSEFYITLFFLLETLHVTELGTVIRTSCECFELPCWKWQNVGPGKWRQTCTNIYYLVSELFKAPVKIISFIL